MLRESTVGWLLTTTDGWKEREMGNSVLVPAKHQPGHSSTLLASLCSAACLQPSHPVSPCKENIAPAHLSRTACPPTGFRAFPSPSLTPALVLWLRDLSAEAERKKEVCSLHRTSPRGTSLSTGIFPKYRGQGFQRWSMHGGGLGC